MKNEFLLVQRGLSILVLVAVTIGCAVQPPMTETVPASPEIRPPLPIAELFDLPSEVASFDDLIQLTPTQAQHFLDWFNAPQRSGTREDQRVADYLQSRLAGVLFDHETRSAADALSLGRGNCLSLALVTTAVTRLAGVSIDWRLTRNFPIYSADGSIVFSANHVYMHLYDPDFVPELGLIKLIRPHVAIDFFTDRPSISGQVLDDQELKALTYQNLAAEALAAGELSSSFFLVLEGLEHDPGNAELYNILGVLHQRKDAWSKAEAYYRFALRLEENRLVTLRNLESLLMRQGRLDEAEQITRQIRALPDTDPYPLIKSGDQAVAQGEWRAALRYFRQARDIAPYLPEVQSRIALIENRRGGALPSRVAMPESMAKAETRFKMISPKL